MELHTGPAADTLAALLAQLGQAGSYDFAFVDADKKGYRGYHEQLLQVGGLRVEGGGLLVCQRRCYHCISLA